MNVKFFHKSYLIFFLFSGIAFAISNTKSGPNLLKNNSRKHFLYIKEKNHKNINNDKDNNNEYYNVIDSTSEDQLAEKELMILKQKEKALKDKKLKEENIKRKKNQEKALKEQKIKEEKIRKLIKSLEKDLDKIPEVTDEDANWNGLY